MGGLRIFETFQTIRKFNPAIFVLLLIFMFIAIQTYNLDVSFEKKIFPLSVSFSLFVIGTFFEYSRIEKKMKEKEHSIKL